MEGEAQWLGVDACSLLTGRTGAADCGMKAQ